MKKRDWCNGAVCIWWLNESDCKTGSDSDWGKLPAYIFEQLNDRYGRAGRGRLWVSDKFKKRKFQVQEESFKGPISDAVMECGGIVILQNDLQSISRLPGLVTDFQLSRITTGESS